MSGRNYIAIIDERTATTLFSLLRFALWLIRSMYYTWLAAPHQKSIDTYYFGIPEVRSMDNRSIAQQYRQTLDRTADDLDPVLMSTCLAKQFHFQNQFAHVILVVPLWMVAFAMNSIRNSTRVEIGQRWIHIVDCVILAILMPICLIAAAEAHFCSYTQICIHL